MSGSTSSRRRTGRPADNEPYPAEIENIRRLPYGLRGFRRFAKLLGLKIHPYQAYMLGFYFAGVTELVILIPKKNGKTTLLAAVALYHLLMRHNAKCYIGAASEDQAARMHEAASDLVFDAGLERRALPGDRREPTRYTGVFEVRGGMHLIRFEGGFIRILPHDVRGGDGVAPTLALVDELHRHPTGALYHVFRHGIIGPGGQVITISTAGASIDSPLGELLEQARTYPGEREDKRRTYRSPNGAFVGIEWALDLDDDPEDIGAVFKANPAPWITKKILRELRQSPSTSKGEWLRFACGIWTEGEEPAITPGDWDPLRADIGQIRDGDTVFLAPSMGHDGAIGIAAVREDRVAVRAEVIEVTEGRSIQADVEDRLAELCERYRVVEIAHPVRSKIRSFELLKMRGLPVTEHPDVPVRIAAWTETFTRLLRSGLLMHDGDPVLRKHVLAGQLKVSETGERFLVSERSRALMAVMAAVHVASAYEAPKKPRIHAYSGGA